MMSNVMLQVHNLAVECPELKALDVVYSKEAES